MQCQLLYRPASRTRTARSPSSLAPSALAIVFQSIEGVTLHCTRRVHECVSTVRVLLISSTFGVFGIRNRRRHLTPLSSRHLLIIGGFQTITFTLRTSSNVSYYCRVYRRWFLTAFIATIFQTSFVFCVWRLKNTSTCFGTSLWATSTTVALEHGPCLMGSHESYLPPTRMFYTSKGRATPGNIITSAIFNSNHPMFTTRCTTTKVWQPVSRVLAASGSWTRAPGVRV